MSSCKKTDLCEYEDLTTLSAKQLLAMEYEWKKILFTAAKCCLFESLII